MELIQIYECLCDPTRLRIVNLLMRGPLCVCHLQELLEEPQVKISKHLSYLKERGLAEVRRHQNWMIYSLPAKPAAELQANLECLQQCVQREPVLKRDLQKLRALLPEVEWLTELCECAPRPRAGGKGQKKMTTACR